MLFSLRKHHAILAGRSNMGHWFVDWFPTRGPATLATTLRAGRYLLPQLTVVMCLSTALAGCVTCITTEAAQVVLNTPKGLGVGDVRELLVPLVGWSEVLYLGWP